MLQLCDRLESQSCGGGVGAGPEVLTGQVCRTQERGSLEEVCTVNFVHLSSARLV